MRKGILIVAVIAAGVTAFWIRYRFRAVSPRVTQTAAPMPVAAGSAALDGKARIPFADARPILDAHRQDLPPDLKNMAPEALGPLWPAWVAP